MKKILLTLFLALTLIIPGVLAINLEIQQVSSDEVMILNSNMPTTFNLTVKNNGASDNFLFYTFFGILESPTEKINIKSGETKQITLEILPSYTLQEGYFNFDIFVQDSQKNDATKELTVKAIALENAFEIGSGDLNPGANTMQIYLKNKINFDFDNINAKFSSVFFNLDESFPLAPHEKKFFEVKLNEEEFSKVTAGFYTVSGEIDTIGQIADIEGTIKFSEKNLLNISDEKYGFIVDKRVILKSNEGNVVTSSETIVKKSIISRLFTTLSPEPDFVDREGAKIYYTWVREIKPGETLRIVIKTNWLLPLVILFLIFATVFLARQYLMTDLSLRKKVSFVRAKGGEFALKVSVVVSARKYLDNITVTERLPAIVKLYERFGQEVPSRVDEKRKIIEWNFKKLQPGEVRVLSYIIYSRVGVVGRFALPSASAVYEKDGKIGQSGSNLAFFVAEQRVKDEEEK